ncbi:hypothetical protein G3545_06270 [Starkeya sp. ORNL1]|uniref:hypothetical protein n=1 Tax=Starkeya sp. ORNL1 TaxID=2709380 RepID=UPI001463CF50|nr:hypothetical protein [Starkeya sp. ORNL1]QJP13290.1 hypothetical protein G3545_06270 [Starkeya sp. ORNL1]
MIETLGEAYDLSWKVHARCGRGSRVGVTKVGWCDWSSDLDLKTLVVKGGTSPLRTLRAGCASRGAEA